MIMKMIARDGATMMEQSVRFTVLDPLLAQLEKHDAVHAQLASWRRLSSEMEEFMLSAQRMKTTTLLFDQDDRRRIAADARLANMQAQLVQLQNAVTPQLGVCFVLLNGVSSRPLTVVMSCRGHYEYGRGAKASGSVHSHGE